MITTGTVLDERYRLDEHLSRGGVGDVFAAYDLALEREVAVKVVRTAEADHPERFRVEARALARLDHPGIVCVHDVGEHGGSPFLVMELVRGDTLSQRMASGPLSPSETARIGAALAAALAYAHDHGVVHRDVKPSNVLFDARDEVHLADFGIARLADSARLTATGMTVGTAAFLSPEQLAGETVGPPTDVYSLGLILLEALTAQQPFAEAGANAMLARLHMDPPVPDDLPEPWPDTLRDMLARSPQDRVRAAELASRLSAGEASADPPVTTATHAVTGTDGPARDTTRALAAHPSAASGTTGAQDPSGDDSGGRYRLTRGGAAAAAAAVLAAALTLFLAGSGTSSRTAGDTPSEASRATTVTPTPSRDGANGDSVMVPREPMIAVPDDREARRAPESDAIANNGDEQNDGAARGRPGGANPPGKAKGHDG